MRHHHDNACSCGDGDRKALQTLRQTSLAELPTEDYNEIVAAVNAAGGVAKTRGLPRVLIQKAVREFNEGVAKGDYVGHPFRGNQWTDASGASRGGASSSGNSADMANRQLAAVGERGVMFEGLKASVSANLKGDKQAAKLLSRAEEYGIGTKAGKDALGDLRDYLEDQNYHAEAQAVMNVLNPRQASRESKRDVIAMAEEMVISTIADNTDEAASDVDNQVKGLAIYTQRAMESSSQAVSRLEQAENMDELDDDGQPSLLQRRLENDVRATKRAAEAAKLVSQATQKAQQLLVRVASKQMKASKSDDLRSDLDALNKNKKLLIICMRL
jgi:hypothetical protein